MYTCPLGKHLKRPTWFIELTQRDLYANNLLNAFDFNQKPSLAHVVPLTTAELAAIRPYINLVRTID